MRPWMILLNNFAHDLFTGLWFGSFLTFYILRQRLGGLDAQQQALLQGVADSLYGLFFQLCLLFLGLVALTGLFRFLYYREGGNEVEVHDPALRKRMLIVKHAVLGSAFLVGTGLVVYWSR